MYSSLLFLTFVSESKEKLKPRNFLTKEKLASSLVLILSTSVQCYQNTGILFTSRASAGSRFPFHKCCAWPQRQLHLSPLQIPNSCVKGFGAGGDSPTVTAASCHDWPVQRAIDQRSCRTRCQHAAAGGQSDESAGTELIESQSDGHPPETGAGHSNLCLWHRSASTAFVLNSSFPEYL